MKNRMNATKILIMILEVLGFQQICFAWNTVIIVYTAFQLLLEKNIHLLPEPVGDIQKTKC